MSTNLKLTQISDELRKKNIPLILLKGITVDSDTDINTVVNDLEEDYLKIKDGFRG